MGDLDAVPGAVSTALGVRRVNLDHPAGTVDLAAATAGLEFVALVSDGI